MKRVLVVVSALLLALAIVSCGNLAVDKKGDGGSLVINLGGSETRSTQATIKDDAGNSIGNVTLRTSDDVTDWELFLYTSTGTDVSYTVKEPASSVIQFDDLPEGEFAVGIVAYDGDTPFGFAQSNYNAETGTIDTVTIKAGTVATTEVDFVYMKSISCTGSDKSFMNVHYSTIRPSANIPGSIYVPGFKDHSPVGKEFDYWTVDGDTSGTHYNPNDEVDLNGKTLPIVFVPVWKDATNPPGGGNNNPPGGNVPAGFVRFAGGTVESAIPNSNSSGPFGIDRFYDDDFPITINAFYLAETELTYARWYEVYSQKDTKGYSFCNEGLNGYDNIGGTGEGGGFPTTGEGARTDYPVTTINWRDAIVWCNLASELEGLTPVYWEQGTTDFNDTSKVIRISETDKPNTGDGKAENAVINPEANGYRLPTDEEWEFAARGGIVSTDADAPWNWEYLGASTAEGTAVYYNTDADAGAHTVPVKQFESYAGVYDMIGNVKEFVVNPRKASSYNRPIRGGSYASVYKKFYDIYDGVSCTQTSQYIGFRVARNAN